MMPIKQSIPLYLSPVYAGFPGATSDYIDKHLDLNEYLIKHPSATFFVKASGSSMIGAGIQDGDILVVDKSKEAKHNSIVIAVLEGEFTVKRLMKKSSGTYLMPENPKYPPIPITETSNFEMWGVVTYVIHAAV